MTVRFFQRRYPSANCVLLEGADPVLVDSGDGGDVDDLLRHLGAPPGRVANTHFHTDHVGGNHALQMRFGCRIAAAVGDAALVNAWSPDACDRRWLVQPVDPYTVDDILAPGDEIETGDARWTVLATPGHTADHLSFFCAAERILVAGDALHDADLGWLDPRTAEAIDECAATVERLAALEARIAFSGHGPALTDLPAAIGRARRRLATWRRDPEQVGWHACKRIFAHALILASGIAEAELVPTLLASPWLLDHARLVFRADPASVAAALLREMVRSGAAHHRDGRLVASAA